VITATIASCALAFAVVAAQESQPADKPAAKPAAKEHTMTGCLQKGTEADTYIVENTAEKGPKTIGIVSADAKLKLVPHVGHKIDITGMAVPIKEAESMTPAPPKADHYMKITAIKMVSKTCP
jgi:hypothetical protein